MYEAYKRLKPDVTVVKKGKQGTNSEAVWSKARLE
jgi:hypothetical protein